MPPPPPPFWPPNPLPDEIAFLEGMTVVYKSSIDLFLYVVGSCQENEVGCIPKSNPPLQPWVWILAGSSPWAVGFSLPVEHTIWASMINLIFSGNTHRSTTQMKPTQTSSACWQHPTHYPDTATRMTTVYLSITTVSDSISLCIGCWP